MRRSRFEAARFVESGRRHEHDRGIRTASELDEARENHRCLGTCEDDSSPWVTDRRRTLCEDLQASTQRQSHDHEETHANHLKNVVRTTVCDVLPTRA